MLPLISAVKDSPQDDASHVVDWDGASHAVSFHLLVNQTAHDLKVFWMCGVHQRFHGILKAGSNTYIGTCDFHEWRLRDSVGQLLYSYKGPSATIYIRDDMICHVVPNVTSSGPYPDPAALGPDQEGAPAAWGQYKQRAVMWGIPIMAFDCVQPSAVEAACLLLHRMLSGCPDNIVHRLVGANAQVGIIAREQNPSDLPPHRFMRHTTDRDIDGTCRGLGGTRAVPTTSVAEENLLLQDTRFHNQSILVHELAHAVLNMAMADAQVACLNQLYAAAKQQQLYPADCYMMANAQEYWAVAAEAWLESTTRTDINGGINTRAALTSHDPGIAKLLEEVFGNAPPWFHMVKDDICKLVQ